MQRTNVALYARVSTTDQKCESQLRELRAYVKRRGWRVVREYVDTGWSGSKSSRPAFDKLKAEAGQHHFDAVLVWKLDRFSRSLMGLVTDLEVLRSQSIRFLAVSQNIDTDENSPTGRLLLNLLAVFAEFERELIRERICAGLRNARAKGVQLGRKRAVFDRERAREMRAGGASYRVIARACGVGVDTVHRAISAA